MCAGTQSAPGFGRTLVHRSNTTAVSGRLRPLWYLVAPASTGKPFLTTASNHLLDLLPTESRARLLGLCEPVPLALAQVLCEPGTPTTHVYFPTQGFISLVTQVDDHAGIEVGMVGREGMLGVQLVLGVVTAPLRALVQGPGGALRVRIDAFQGELARSSALRRCLHRYLYVLMRQLATAAPCLRFHLISHRLARWLLMSQDRAQADHFRVTHEFLAYMLGVRRVGVTAAAGGLQRR